MNASERGDEMMVPLLLIPLTPGWPGNPQTSGMFHFLYFDDTDRHCLSHSAEAHSSKQGIRETDGIFQVDQQIIRPMETRFQ